MKKTNFNIPENLEKETYDYMNVIMSYLKKNDKFNKIDSGALYMLATSYNTYIRASKQLNEEGLTVISNQGNRGIHPCFNIMKASIAQAMNILVEFGLTLRSRSKLNVINSMDGNEEESPLLAFIKSEK